MFIFKHLFFLCRIVESATSRHVVVVLPGNQSIYVKKKKKIYVKSFEDEFLRHIALVLVH